MRLVRRRAWIAVSVAVVVVGSSLLFVVFARGGTFMATAPSAQMPPWPAIAVVPAVYDGATGFDLWLFPQGATWTYANGTWSNITSFAGIPPNMEANTRMVYDDRDGYVLLYGGANPFSSLKGEVPLAETWKFDAGRWSNLTATVTGAPSPRVLGLMAYDSADREVVLFGGSLPHGPYALNETWTYAGGVWTNATVPAPPPVSGFYGIVPLGAMVDDPSSGYVLYYDGLGVCPRTACPIAWTYRAGVWTNRTASAAPLAHFPEFEMFTYDTALAAVVAAGYCTSTALYTCAHTNTTFVWVNGTWDDVTPSAQLPYRLFTSWVDDPSDGGVMVVGGCCWGDFSGLSLSWDDVWVYAHGTWTESEPWGGSTPSWIESDGSWLAIGLLATSLAPIAYVVRSRTSGPPR